MLIGNNEYKFAYTVGAYLDIAELKIPKPTTMAENDKLYAWSAVLMNKAFEDRLKLDDPEYKPTYLTIAEVRALPYKDFKLLKSEIDEAYKRDGNITVKTQPKETPKNAKKAEGAVQGK